MTTAILSDPENKTLYSRPIQIAEFKAAGDGEWEVSGYVSTFNNEDYGGDVVRPGAFKKTLVSGPKVRFLRDHDPRMLLGVPLKLKEDSKGLFGRFKISKTRLGEETHELLKDEALDSFSFSYHADVYEIDEKDQIRYLNELTLFEASLVAMPMNPEAAVTGFKSGWAALGVDAGATLADKIRAYSEGMKELTSDLRGLTKDGQNPLSEKKRRELSELLELCSAMDVVRSDLKALASPIEPVGAVLTKQASYELREARKRLAHILTEE